MDLQGHSVDKEIKEAILEAFEALTSGGDGDEGETRGAETDTGYGYAAADPHVRLLVWWPAEGTPLEAEWSRETLAVVGRVLRAEGASLYRRPGTEALHDDLQDWLLAEAMEFRDHYVPPDDPQPSEFVAWCATLHHVLAQRARWHFSRVMRVGLSPEQT
jgi:hypothetical protein